MGSILSWFLGIVGGVIGYFAGGPYGAVVGFSLGMGIGSVIDPQTPDVPQPGEPMKDVEIMTNKEGIALPDVIGTTKLSGNLLWFGNNRRVEVTEEVESGGSSNSGGDETVVTGYEFYLSWAMGLCLGPVDTLYTIYKEDIVVWAGELNRPESGGMISIFLTENYAQQMYFSDPLTGGFTPEVLAQIKASQSWYAQGDSPYMGIANFYFGTMDQDPDSQLGALMLAAGTIPDANYNIPYRGQCWIYFHDCFIGGFNRCPTMKFVIKKSPDCSFDP